MAFLFPLWGVPDTGLHTYPVFKALSFPVKRKQHKMPGCSCSFLHQPLASLYSSARCVTVAPSLQLAASIYSRADPAQFPSRYLALHEYLSPPQEYQHSPMQELTRHLSKPAVQPFWETCTQTPAKSPWDATYLLYFSTGSDYSNAQTRVRHCQTQKVNTPHFHPALLCTGQELRECVSKLTRYS